MKQRCILLYVNPYHMVDDKTGVVNQGLSVYYVGTDSLEPVEDGNKKGVPVLKQSFDLSLEESIVAVPGYYDLEFALRPVGGKPTVVPVGLTYLSEVTKGGKQ